VRLTCEQRATHAVGNAARPHLARQGPLPVLRGASGDQSPLHAHRPRTSASWPDRHVADARAEERSRQKATVEVGGDIPSADASHLARVRPDRLGDIGKRPRGKHSDHCVAVEALDEEGASHSKRQITRGDEPQIWPNPCLRAQAGLQGCARSVRAKMTTSGGPFRAPVKLER